MQGQQANLRELKQCVRKRILQARRAISPAERDARSNIISDSLFTKINNLYTIFSNSTHSGPFTIALYCAMNEEVSLAPFIQRAQTQSWALCFPCMIKPECECDTQACAGSDRPCNNDQPCNNDRPYNNDPQNESTNIHAVNNSTPHNPRQHNVCANNTQQTYEAANKTYVFEKQQPKVRNKMHFVELNAASVEHKSLEFLVHPARAYTQSDIEQQIQQDSYTMRIRWVQADEFHAIVVPVVGFDDTNMRLGYGQGNYDEFLVQCSPNSSIIGVAFKEQHVECVYPEPHDVALPDIIVG